MASGWEIAAVIGPMILAFVAMIVSSIVSASPAATAFFQRWTRRVLSYALPSRARCYRLSWKDIPEGRIHQCHPACQHVNPQTVQLHNPTNCWDESIGRTFNQMWSSVNKDMSTGTKTISKPYQLPLFRDFIQTDSQTLMAFLLLTVDICRTCASADMKSMLEIKTYSNIVTVHLKASILAPTNTALTKFEVEKMIDGYPPFYRETFSIPGAQDLRLINPISKNHHNNISRGAWVLAVGLSVSNGPILSLYNMQQLREKNSDNYWKGTLVMSAFEMIHHTLTQLLAFEDSFLRSAQHRPHYEGVGLNNLSLWSGQALHCYRLMMNQAWSLKPWVLKTQEIESQRLFESLIGECPCTRTCLGGNPHSETCGRGQVTRKDAAKKLSVEQCEAALEIFNNYSHSRKNLDIIFPVLREVLQTVILGMCEVEHYFSKTGQQLDLPEILKGHRYIYLRACASDVD